MSARARREKKKFRRSKTSRLWKETKAVKGAENKLRDERAVFVSRECVGQQRAGHKRIGGAQEGARETVRQQCKSQGLVSSDEQRVRRT